MTLVIVKLPEAPLVSDHPPDAVHEVVSVEDQVRVTESPEATVPKFDEKVTVGVG